MPRVLIYGFDAALLETRRLLLEQAGYEAQIANTPGEFSEQVSGEQARFGLLVVCHTVPLAEQARIKPMAESSGMALYQMSLLIRPPEFLSHVADLLS